MLGRDSAHSGHCPFDTTANAGKLRWQFRAGGWVGSSPVIGPDGTIYVGNDNAVKVAGGGTQATTGGNLFAVRPDGTLKWRLPIYGSTQRISPAIGPDGTIYIRSDGYSFIFGRSYLYAAWPDGSLRWKFPIDVASGSPIVGADGTIYIGDGEGYLHAVAPGGNEKWRFNVGMENGSGEVALQGSTPALGRDGTVYVGSCDNNLYAVTESGHLKWKFPTQDQVCYSVPTVSPSGTIFVGSNDGHLYAVSLDGKLKWKFATHNWAGSPAVDTAGNVYFGSGDELYALNGDGILKWSVKVGTMFGAYGAPVLGDDGTVYVTAGSNVDAFAPGGTPKWTLPGSCGEMSPSVAVGSDGVIYAGSMDGNLYAIKDTVTTAAVPPSFDMGEAAVGEEVRKTLAIRNTGKLALFIFGEHMDCYKEFEDVVSQCSAAPGEPCDITLRFRPGERGRRSQTMIINDNAAPGYQTVTLTGTGN